MTDSKPSLLVFGAHPDDCEFTAGGLAALYAAQGSRVCFVSVTNGDAGHQTEAGAALAHRRHAEALASGAVIGIDYVIMDNHDGELLPTLDRRREIIKLIREFKPDLVLTPRPNDYHPDHRYTSTLVQDAAYMITVPNALASAPHLPRNPVIMYLIDHFQKPYPFTPDVAVDITSVIDKKYEMLHAHTSQMYEWLPYNTGTLDQVPATPEERLAWLKSNRAVRLKGTAERFRPLLVQRYGEERGNAIEFAEAFEACEYGAPLTPEARERLFPF